MSAGRDVGDQHVLEHVGGEQVAVAELVERRDERQHEDREPEREQRRAVPRRRGRRARAAAAAGSPARSTRPRRRRARARAARPSTATRGRAGSQRLESYFARSQHGRSSHARGQSPAMPATAMAYRDTSGDCPQTCRSETRPGTVPRRGRNGHVLPRRVWGLSPRHVSVRRVRRGGLRASSGGSQRPLRRRADPCCINQAKETDDTSHLAQTRNRLGARPRLVSGGGPMIRAAVIATVAALALATQPALAANRRRRSLRRSPPLRRSARRPRQSLPTSPAEHPRRRRPRARREERHRLQRRRSATK